MQCACAILSSVACLAVQYFSTLSHKRHDFRKENLLKIKYVFWFPLWSFSEICHILRRIERDMIKNCLHIKYPLFLSDFKETGIFSVDFGKGTELWNFPKIHTLGVKLFHADGRTDGQTDGKADMTNLIFAFCNFANAPQNRCHVRCFWWCSESFCASKSSYKSLRGSLLS